MILWEEEEEEKSVLILLEEEEEKTKEELSLFLRHQHVMSHQELEGRKGLCPSYGRR